MKSFFATMLLAASAMAIKLHAPTEGEIRRALKEEGISKKELMRLCAENPEDCAEAKRFVEDEMKLAQKGG